MTYGLIHHGGLVIVIDFLQYNTSLVKVYNLQSQLNFTSAIQFPNFPNIAALFSFPALNSMTSSVNTMTLQNYVDSNGMAFTTSPLGANAALNALMVGLVVCCFFKGKMRV